MALTISLGIFALLSIILALSLQHAVKQPK